jgi:hypothetical protein
MSAVAKSIFYYSFYMMGMGLGLFFIPNRILEIFGFAPTTEIWVRLLGLLAFCTGILYFHCARTDQTGFFRVSVPERVIFFLGTVALVILFDITPMLALIGSVDLLGAAWTWLTFRQENPGIQRKSR